MASLTPRYSNSLTLWNPVLHAIQLVSPRMRGLTKRMADLEALILWLVQLRYLLRRLTILLALETEAWVVIGMSSAYSKWDTWVPPLAIATLKSCPLSLKVLERSFDHKMKIYGYNGHPCWNLHLASIHGVLLPFIKIDKCGCEIHSMIHLLNFTDVPINCITRWRVIRLMRSNACSMSTLMTIKLDWDVECWCLLIISWASKKWYEMTLQRTNATLFLCD